MTLNGRTQRFITTMLVAGVIGTWQGATAWADGPLEDEPGWSCVDMGDQRCGPGNSNGVPAGCYDDGGVMFAAWPCTAWSPSDGWRHGDGSITFPDGHTVAPGPDCKDICLGA